MSVRLPNGATISIASAYASPVTVSALSNASPPVATATQSYTNGDFVEVTSGWSKLNNRIVKVASESGTQFSFSGIDTTDTTKYPACNGIGTVRKITTFQQITQVLGLTANGGDQQFATYEFLESDDQFQIPTVRAPQSLVLQIADDTSAPHYAILAAADADRLQRALLVTLPSGSQIAYDAYITMNPTPSLTKGNIMALTVTASLLALPVRY